MPSAETQLQGLTHVQELERRFIKSRVFLQGDVFYDRNRRILYGGDKASWGSPDIIVLCGALADAITLQEWCYKHDHQLFFRSEMQPLSSVLSTYQKRPVCVCDIGPMDDIEVYPVRAVAYVKGGISIEEVADFAAWSGLVLEAGYSDKSKSLIDFARGSYALSVLLSNC
ncbi:hypothetical protein FOZ60_002545 [Perkinsus olseni]|uniref:Uncharacterized protein n=1 Tax=Perkinsus olseni TaxID=32597 RepID=A0A7J6NYG6_PEROL|nr:hypothetical protein FOZ60_002545 [Perkinsus olseni]